MAVDALSHGYYSHSVRVRAVARLRSRSSRDPCDTLLSLCSGQTSHTLEPRHDGRDATNGGVARAEAQVWA